MKILYGVVGEGMGHAMRSRVILEHLVAAGHDLEVMASGRAVEFLGKRFESVNRIHGLHMIYDENRVRLGRTLWSNVLSGAAGVPQNIAAYFELISSFHPEVVISDFESWTYFYGKAHGLPTISVDNMQIINRCTHPPAVLEGHEGDFQLTKAFVKSKLPFCERYLITTFFHPEVRKDRTKLFPPILRKEILDARAGAAAGEHLLVYQTAEGNDALAGVLAASGVECRVYGMRRAITEEQVEGNIRYRPFSEAGFIADLASARAVVAGGGFTLMGEAVYLGKPMLAIPVGGQFEQVLNSRYLSHLGYGRMSERLDDPAELRAFLDAVPACAERLTAHRQEGNKLILDEIDHLLDCVAAGIL
jgi:uncharacterized protein (TIGR00661 family)